MQPAREARQTGGVRVLVTAAMVQMLAIPSTGIVDDNIEQAVDDILMTETDVRTKDLVHCHSSILGCESPEPITVKPLRVTRIPILRVVKALERVIRHWPHAVLPPSGGEGRGNQVEGRGFPDAAYGPGFRASRPAAGRGG